MRSFAHGLGATFFGPRARLVEIEVVVVVDDQGGVGNMRIVGLPDSALREGRERIRGAILHADWPWPNRSVTVNLAPAAARKEGAALDLPIALGVLAAQGVLGPSMAEGLGRWLCLGELGLDGGVRSVRGVLAAAEAARRSGRRHALVPLSNAAEAASISGLEVVAVSELSEAVGHLSGVQPLVPTEPRPWAPELPDPTAPIIIRGQPIAVEAGRVAAAGGHNLLLWGPPGAGKTLLAHQIRDWMPPLTLSEALEASRVHSVAGLLADGLLTRRPFRAPHHTSSAAGLVGGGSVLRPGEFSLAHMGILFLDELPEFDRRSLESLRQPLESGRLEVARASGKVHFPADLMLVAATNPCPCGWNGTEGDRCQCSQRVVKRYQRRISGPLRDRFDLEVQLPPVDPETLICAPAGVEAGNGQEQLERAVEAQTRRAQALGMPRALNARIPGECLPAAATPTSAAAADLVRLARSLDLTARGVHRLTRVARTIADLDGDERVRRKHLLRAVAFRRE